MVKFWQRAGTAALILSPLYAPAAQAQGTAAVQAMDEIIITATKRATPLQDVPIAVSAVSGDALQNSGASDVRQLNQLAPSLLVSSSSSEAQGAAARIRGVGTVGDNAGLESSVTVFIDGVYRSRTGTGMTELGNIERIEVLRGPQGTLFGRNASSGLINVVTRGPKLGTLSGYANATYGNYDFLNLGAGVNVPLGASMAASLDGVFVKRDGFLKDVVSGRKINDRDRWLLRGQLGWEPTESIRVRLIGDYTQRREECCGATYMPARVVTRDALNSLTVTNGNGAGATVPTIRIDNALSTVNENGAAGRAVNFAYLLRNISSGLAGVGTGIVNDDPAQRLTAITPGRSFRSDVDDWGISAQVDWDMGGAKLTSISAYRDWQVNRAQDSDIVSNLDIMHRMNQQQAFKTFSQELRLQGNHSILDWLVGGYYANEKLTFDDDLSYGNDWGRVNSCNLAYAVGLAALASPGSTGCLSAAGRTAAGGAFGVAAPLILAAFDRLYNTANVGNHDVFHQKSENWAAFTHNVIHVSDRFDVTLGLRYTEERKTLDASFSNTNSFCAAQAAAMSSIITGGSALAPLAANLRALTCASNNGAIPNGTIAQRKKESQWTGTAVASYKLTDALMSYASYSKGYKAGGFNLERAGFTPFSTSLNPAQLQFAPEKVDAYELGAKYFGGTVSANLALYYQDIENFQLNTFNGVSFLVKNVPVTAKGAELDVQVRPVPALTLSGGAAIGKTSYSNDIVFNSTTERNSLFLLPGSVISNAPRYVFTGSAAYEMPLTAGLSALLYGDFRYQSDINTGSDLFPEKQQDGFVLVNARLGISGDDKRWGLEFWVQNLFDTTYTQVAAGMPLQGSGSIASLQTGRAESANTMFGAFLGEPRTYGVTARYKF